MIGLGEVDLAPERLRDPCVIGEFAAVIERDGLDRIVHGLHHGHDGVRHCGRGASPYGITGEKPGFTLQQRDSRALMTGTNDADAFPVAKGHVGVHFRRALNDIDAIRDEMCGAVGGTYAEATLPTRRRHSPLPVRAVRRHTTWRASAQSSWCDVRLQWDIGLRGAKVDVVKMFQGHIARA